jgi:hypothetical protein
MEPYFVLMKLLQEEYQFLLMTPLTPAVGTT